MSWSAHELDRDECLSLVGREQVGRVVVCTPAGPEVVPVAYVLHDGAVLFRTSPYGVLARHLDHQLAAFEVDHLTSPQQGGWSVVVRGRATCHGPGEPEVRDAPSPTPWVDGSRQLHVRIGCTEVSGRRLGPAPAP